MFWTFLVLALWLKSGAPEPHLITLGPGTECSAEVAAEMREFVIAHSDHADQYSHDYAYSCDRAKSPEVKDGAAPAAPKYKAIPEGGI